jgi:hypothetical protein
MAKIGNRRLPSGPAAGLSLYEEVSLRQHRTHIRIRVRLVLDRHVVLQVAHAAVTRPAGIFVQPPLPPCGM